MEESLKMEKKGFVYILTNKKKTTLYVGVTSNLERRINEHKSHLIKGFTHKYNLDCLIYVEECGSIEEAIQREKQLKGWRREKKINLIKAVNPQMKDLSE